MTLALTERQQQALAAAPPDAPAKASDPDTHAVVVLLKSADFDWIRGLLGDEPDAPRGTDPRTGEAFALVPESRYERFKAFFEEDPITPAERACLLREAGKRAGWDDPAWDEDDAHNSREAS